MDAGAPGGGKKCSIFTKVGVFVKERGGTWLANPRDKNRSLSGDESIVARSEMRIRISLRTYRLFYEAGMEDVFVHRRGREEEKALQERVRRRNEERRRCRLLQD